MRVYFRFLFWLLKIAAPANVAFFPAIALYGAFFIWGPAEEALSRYTEEIAVMVGAGAESRYSITGSREERYESNQRTYLLFPSVLRNPKLVTVREINRNRTEVTESREGFFFLATWYLLCIFGTWWFWLRRKPINQEDASPNI